MLAGDWILIETLKDDYGHPIERHESLAFVLGNENPNADIPE